MRYSHTQADSRRGSDDSTLPDTLPDRHSSLGHPTDKNPALRVFTSRGMSREVSGQDVMTFARRRISSLPGRNTGRTTRSATGRMLDVKIPYLKA